MMDNKGHGVCDIKQGLLQEAAELVWYHQQDREGELEQLTAKLAKLDAEISQLEKELPALQKARDEAKAYLDDLIGRRIPEALDDRGNLRSEARLEARREWLSAGHALSVVDGPLSSRRLERTLLRGEIADFEELERPATPLLDELIEALKE
jgi:chromosome segregation ATPase